MELPRGLTLVGMSMIDQIRLTRKRLGCSVCKNLSDRAPRCGPSQTDRIERRTSPRLAESIFPLPFCRVPGYAIGSTLNRNLDIIEYGFKSLYDRPPFARGAMPF